ncbi:MAG: transglycosylase SLT domain-containing protein [Candidatus Sungbacteria bacterium]|nr:transglycosylase SLT domain-containing protein [Candidatus Sungbacteria bacterium]
MNTYVRQARIGILSLVLVSAFFFLSPAFARAQGSGLIPCGTKTLTTESGDKITANPCTACDIFKLAQNILNFLWTYVSVPLAALLFAYGGILMILGGASAPLREKGKKVIINVLWGLAIIFFSWIAIDTIMKLVGSRLAAGAPGFSRGEFGPWNEFRCTATPSTLGFFGRSPAEAARGSRLNLISADIPVGPGQAGADAIIRRTAPYRNQIEELARQNNISSSDILSIVAIESAGQASVCSQKGACGIMQMLPDTARNLDRSRLGGLSDGEVIQYLNANPGESIRLGTQHYVNLLRKHGSQELALAAYNGGEGNTNAPYNSRTNPGALTQSNSCLGVRAYQCPWDSPGCYNTGRTDCAPNTGFLETRLYIQRFQQYRAQFEQKRQSL